MQYIQLRDKLKDFPVFSLADIRKLDPDFHRPRLHEWQRKGYLKKLRRGYYLFTDTSLDEGMLFFIANRLYAPSYISFEMALSYYGLIPEAVYGITAATTRKTSRFTTPVGTFSYRRVKAQLFFGYTLVAHRHMHFTIAEMEKALLDYFYLHPRLKDAEDFAGLRFDGATFLDRLNRKKLMRYLALFHNEYLTRRLKSFLAYCRQH